MNEDFKTTLLDIIRIEQEHHKYRNETLNLIASENIMSNLVRTALSSGFGNRYALGMPHKRIINNWSFPGIKYIDEIEYKASEVAKQLFCAEDVDMRPLSGSCCVNALIFSMTKSGESMFRVSDECGGHFATEPIAERLGVKIEYLPYDYSEYIIDVDEAAKKINNSKSRLIYLDASHLLFPHPISELKKKLDDNKFISYDGSQVLGLIAGGQFANPLQEGANLLQGSTHKTLWGPQKGMFIYGNNVTSHEKENLIQVVSPHLISNTHLHSSFALSIAILELACFGKQYAEQVIKNARYLAKILHEKGINVFAKNKGFTDSHQLWVCVGDYQTHLEIFSRFEQVGLNVNNIKIPFTKNEFGFRLGVAELTRRGLIEQHMVIIADFIEKTLNIKADINTIRGEISEFIRSFDKVHFCFDESVKIFI